jgi:(p)ppGpp synthase/HD superfamily hydrolase
VKFDPELYARALDFAARAHGAQTVPGSGFPYVVHLAKVAAEALSAVAAEPTLDSGLVLPCALLHDCLEDAGVSFAQVEAAFGAAVALGVSALTKNESLPKAERMPDSLRRLVAQPREVQLVKLADRITNLEPPPPAWGRAKRAAYLLEAGTIVAAVGLASPVLAQRLRERIARYQTFVDAATAP